MKIAMYGATGGVDSRIVAEAARRGQDITALARTAGRAPDGIPIAPAYASDVNAVRKVAAEHNVIVCAFGPSRDHGRGPECLPRAATPLSGTSQKIRAVTSCCGCVRSGALRDPALGEVRHDGLRQARARIGERLGELHSSWPEARRAGAATVVAALLDSLMLHRLSDASLPVDDALAALGDLIGDHS